MPEGFQKVRELVALTADASQDEITLLTRFDALPEWSSLAAIRLLTMIEESFGLRFDLREYLSATTVGELVTLVTGDATSRTGATS
jgi:acyl carrier protein